MGAASDQPVAHPSRTLGMLVHLSTLIGFFLSIPVAAGLIGPGLVWLWSHRSDPYVSAQAREALNFHLSVLLYALALQGLPTPPVLIAVAVVLWLTLTVVVAGLAYEGRPARYPAALPILRALRLRRG